MFSLRTRGLSKTYAGLFGRNPVRALRGLDLQVESGIAFGLIGLNGAGKTTFIKSILGVVRPTAGEVEVLGGHPDDPAVRAKIGYLPERLYLPWALSPRQYLSSIARMKRVRDIPGEVERQLERVGMKKDSGTRMKGFSKGMKQRIGVAAALIGSPELLILDEPTDGVDPLGRAAIRGILDTERRRGATIFLNSHLLTETERFCDRVGIISHGKLELEGNLNELCGAGDRWKVEFAPGTPSEDLEEAGFVKIQETNCFTCTAESPEELNQIIDRARAAGARLTALGPDNRELESVLSDVERETAQ